MIAKVQTVCVVLALSSLVACGTTNTTPLPVQSDADELASVMKEAARQAAAMRVRLAQIPNLPAAQTTSVAPVLVADIKPLTKIDIDYVGPADNAARHVTRMLGWNYSVSGKKRQEALVSLRHSSVDPITILQDIGAQCHTRCDIHVELVEGGQSSVQLTYRD